MNQQINDKNYNLELFTNNGDNFSSSSVIAAQNTENTSVIDKVITLKFINPTWIQVRDSEDVIIVSKLMKKNEEYTYELSSNYFLTAGNAGNIIVSIDNQVRGKVGDFGEVVDSVSIDSNFNN